MFNETQMLNFNLLWLNVFIRFHIFPHKMRTEINTDIVDDLDTDLEIHSKRKDYGKEKGKMSKID